ncbi:MAG: hypothetical protein HQ518_07435 [Rhodopirellula sp.]|nr:hypothetical protein [Rhodopirellula sp.]
MAALLLILTLLSGVTVRSFGADVPGSAETLIVGFNLKFVASGKDHTTDLTLKKLVVHSTRDESTTAKD